MLKDVDIIKKEPIDFSEDEVEYYKKPDEKVWVKEEKETDVNKVNEDLVDDLLEGSKEVEEELVKELLEESKEENGDQDENKESENKEEDEFGFLDDLMMDLKQNGTEGGFVEKEGEEGLPENEEELQNNLLLANL